MPRSGYITASSFADLMKKGRGGEPFGKTALKVIDLLVLDMLGVDRPEEMAAPRSCQWGIDHERDAIDAYEERTLRSVQAPVEFRESPTHAYVGGTMDGLVGPRGGIEVKSPFDSMEHLANLRGAKQLYNDYWYQVQGYFWIYGLEWIDFISYDPRFREPDDLYICRATPDLETINQIKTRCEEAYGIACGKVLEIRGRTGA